MAKLPIATWEDVKPLNATRVHEPGTNSGRLEINVTFSPAKLDTAVRQPARSSAQQSKKTAADVAG